MKPKVTMDERIQEKSVSFLSRRAKYKFYFQVYASTVQNSVTQIVSCLELFNV